jgi:hypothetical protein
MGTYIHNTQSFWFSLSHCKNISSLGCCMSLCARRLFWATSSVVVSSSRKILINMQKCRPYPLPMSLLLLFRILYWRVKTSFAHFPRSLRAYAILYDHINGSTSFPLAIPHHLCIFFQIPLPSFVLVLQMHDTSPWLHMGFSHSCHVF